MLFSSNLFLFLFLPIILLVYFGINKIVKPPILISNLILIIFSFFFYLWGSGLFTAIFLASIFINYLFGRLMAKHARLKKIFLFLGITANLCLLGYFKYFNFFCQQISTWLHLTPPTIVPIFLPIGISFYSFMAISYLVDVYRQQKSANFIDFVLYLSFFPHLVAGPIVRYQEIAEEIKKRQPSIDQFFEGLWRFSLGLSKKVIIANSVGQLTDKVFSLPPNEVGSLLALSGIIAYTIQIYFDFSGYSDMAIGLAGFFGFKFPENFCHPYMASSITDFWRRWHMSLSRFFRDYLYIPLGGNRLVSIRTYFNLIVVFTLCGLWHGASWTFVVWGLYHGVLLVIERILKNKFHYEPKGIFSIILTFSLVSLGWIIFRSPTLSFAINYVKTLFAFSDRLPPFYTLRYFIPPNVAFYLAIGLIFSFFPLTKPKNAYLRGLIILTLTLISLSFLSKISFTPFIYFQF
ncbi:MAG: MBOAT family O-acyltransferase [Candidatus Shapirobacteria bacterium]|jgi:alginate O-acetyltransferase complex protein AlgI